MTPLGGGVSAQRVALAGAAACGVAALLFVGHYLWRGWEQCHPPRLRVTAEETKRAHQLLPELRELEVDGADGTKMRAWYERPRNGIVLVLVPGLGGNRASFLDEAALFAKHGYGSLLLEERDSGESGGETSTWGYLEEDDVSRAVRVAYAQPGVVDVGALGFSVGGSAVVLAAAKDPSIHAVLLYATWTSLREEIAYKTRHRGHWASYWIEKGFELSGTQLNAIQPEQHMQQLAPRAVFLLSGGEDEDTPDWVMKRLLDASASSAQLWRLPTVKHGGYLQSAPQDYEQRVMAFWDGAFAESLQRAAP